MSSQVTVSALWAHIFHFNHISLQTFTCFDLMFQIVCFITVSFLMHTISLMFKMCVEVMWTARAHFQSPISHLIITKTGRI